MLVALTTPAVASGPVTQTFSTPGGPYLFTVPAGVSTLHAEAIGGAGGAFGSYVRGKGADVTADLPVTPGQNLYVYVAGNGSTSGGGTNGGGAPASTSSSAGGGGGASDIRTASGDLGTRVLVAGGGGGGQGCGTAGDAGQPGTQGCGCTPGVGTNGAGPAMPGTDTMGGAGGGGCDGTSGTGGTLGVGGNGGSRPSGGDYGPGGGGGWYGGGGGGPYSGGAGGSSHAEAAATNVNLTTTTAAPKVSIAYTLPASHVSVSLANSSIPGDGSSTSLATARLTDANGNPVAGDQVAFTSTDSGQHIGSVTDHGDGSYTATITASTAPGTATITATDTSAPGRPAGSATLTETALPILLSALPTFAVQPAPRTPLTGPRRDVLRELGITRHHLIQVFANGDFVFPPAPIFLHAGDTLSAVVKLNVGRRSARGKKGRWAMVTTYGTGSVTATRDGPAQLTIHATPAGRAALRRHGRVFVSVHLAFRSAAKLGSTSTSKDFRVKLSKKRRK